MRLICRVLVLTVMMAALGASAAWSPPGNRDDSQHARPPMAVASLETRACPLPADDRAALVPLPDSRGEPTLAPPEPLDGGCHGGVVVVQVEGKSRAPEKALSPIAPVPDLHNEPTLAPPEPVSGGASPRTIIVRVEAELAAE